MTSSSSAPPPARKRRRASLFWLSLVIALGMLLLTLVLIPLARPSAVMGGRRWLGKPAPVLEATDLNGRRWTLADGRGRLVWINFWATWCPPCRTEMPMMQRLAERYGDQLLILGVDFGEESGAVQDYVARYGITYPILLDPNLENFYRWNLQFGLPRHYFVDAHGVVVREIPGELPPQSMLNIIVELLGVPNQSGS